MTRTMKEKVEAQDHEPVESVFGGECPRDPVYLPDTMSELREALTRETGDRRRAECMAKMQSNTMQLALDLLVTEPDIDGFFRVFMKTLVEETDSLACGVFLLDDSVDDKGAHCEMWMAYVGEQLFARNLPEWDTLALPRESMSEHLFQYRPAFATNACGFYT